MSRVIMIISALLSASSSACHGLLIITVDTISLQSLVADVRTENWKLANAAPLAQCRRDVAALSAQNNELVDKWK